MPAFLLPPRGHCLLLLIQRNLPTPLGAATTSAPRVAYASLPTPPASAAVQRPPGQAVSPRCPSTATWAGKPGQERLQQVPGHSRLHALSPGSHGSQARGPGRGQALRENWTGKVPASAGPGGPQRPSGDFSSVTLRIPVPSGHSNKPNVHQSVSGVF